MAATPVGVGDANALAGRLDPLVLGDGDVAVAEAPGRLLAQDPRRSPVGVALDDPAGLVEVPACAREAGGVEPERVVVLRPERGRRVSRDRVERRRRMVGSGHAASRQPVPRIQVPRARVAGDERERCRDRARLLEPHVVSRQRPGRKVDVGVGECRQHAAAREVDALRRREHPLVRADPARHDRPCDRQCPARRQRGVERADDAVVEDHGLRALLAVVLDDARVSLDRDVGVHVGAAERLALAEQVPALVE